VVCSQLRSPEPSEVVLNVVIILASVVVVAYVLLKLVQALMSGENVTPPYAVASGAVSMAFERWTYLWCLLLTTGPATYLFRAAEMTDDTAKGTRMRTNASVCVFLGVLAL
jgi:hypothetical protein